MAGPSDFVVRMTALCVNWAGGGGLFGIYCLVTLRLRGVEAGVNLAGGLRWLRSFGLRRQDDAVVR